MYRDFGVNPVNLTKPMTVFAAEIRKRHVDHLNSRSTYKQNRSVALAEWRQLVA